MCWIGPMRPCCPGWENGHGTSMVIWDRSWDVRIFILPTLQSQIRHRTLALLSLMQPYLGARGAGDSLRLSSSSLFYKPR